MNAPPLFAADDVVAIGASTGGADALRTVAAGLPAQFAAAVLIVMHVGSYDSILPALLAGVTKLPVRHARDGDVLEPGRILIAPPDFHLLVRRDGERCHAVLSRSARENHARPAVDPLFRSVAAAFGPRAIGVILTGHLDDGAAGLAAIKACGGQAVVQLPEEALAPGMPTAALAAADVDRVLRLADIGPALEQMVDANLAAARSAARDTPEWVKLENRLTSEGSDMESLDKIGQPSTYTCPECHGTLWELRQLGPTRYRCHTGHSFTEKFLAVHQGELVEESLWSAVRALQEKEKLLRQMADTALGLGHARVAGDYLDQAAAAQRDAEVLRRLITAGREHGHRLPQAK